MRTELPEDDDARLKVLFSAAAETVGDDGFSERVVQRVAHDTARRRIVLGSAGLVGFGVAALPAWNLVGELANEVIAYVGRVGSFGELIANPLVIAAGVVLLAVPSALRWLEE